MKSSNAKKASITLPAELERHLKTVAREEKRTLSGVLQEAARYYLNVRQYEKFQRELALKAMELDVRTDEDVVDLIRKTRTRSSAR